MKKINLLLNLLLLNLLLTSLIHTNLEARKKDKCSKYYDYYKYELGDNPWRNGDEYQGNSSRQGIYNWNWPSVDSELYWGAHRFY